MRKFPIVMGLFIPNMLVGGEQEASAKDGAFGAINDEEWVGSGRSSMIAQAASACVGG